MIYIFDFEDGLQEFFKEKLKCETETYSFDERGMYKFHKLSTCEKNIIVLSKPYDCLQRGVLSGKYPENNFKQLQDWSRRNWRYTNSEIYEHLNSFISDTENKLVIHPEELNDPITIKRIEKYTDSSFDWDISEYDEFYKQNINLR